MAPEALPGWRDDRTGEVLPALHRSCAALLAKPDNTAVGPNGMAGTVADWRAACAAAPPIGSDDTKVRDYFETSFQAVLISDAGITEGLFTGYYEPELTGARRRSESYPIPLYRPPKDLVADRPYIARAEIDAGALAGRGLELVWLADPVDAFFLHVQGSGRISLAEGGFMRVGFAASNNRPYTAIGRVLVEQGELSREQATMQGIRDWLAANRAAAQSLLRHNERYIFFREIAGDGPIGAQGVPLTPGRSLAVDVDRMPMGAPFWLDTTYPEGTPATGKPLRRLVVAQDKGAAIEGRIRGDVFWGTGETAAAYAGPMRQRGHYYLLLPKAVDAAQM